MTYDFFISFAEEERTYVEELNKTLRQYGLKSWVYFREIRGAEDWTEAINDGVKNSKTAVLIASKNAFNSKHVHREIALADKANLPLICILTENISLPPKFEYFFVDLQHIPAYRMSKEEIADELAKIIQDLFPDQGQGSSPEEADRSPCLEDVEVSRLITRQVIQSIPLEFVRIPEGVVEQKSIGPGERSRNLLQSCFWLSRQPVSRALFAAWLKDIQKPLPPELQDPTRLGEPAMVKDLQEARNFCRWAAEKTGLPIRLPVTLEQNIASGKVHYRDLADDTNPHLIAQPPSPGDWSGAFEWHPKIPILLESALKMSKVHEEGHWVFHLAYNQPLECLEQGSLVASRYEVQDLVSSGGMGSVYRVRDIGSGESLALKEARLSLLPNLELDEDGTNPGRNTIWNRQEALKLFWREAKILSNLSHSNLPAVSNFFIENENAYLVMAFIEGKSLKTLLQEHGRTKRLLDPEKVMFWGSQVMDTLGYCHSRNILHRDVKPDNLRLTPTGKVYLVDFGLARSIICRHAPAAGTYNYAPLEQFQPTGRLSVSSDVYSLGATLYHLLTLQPPTPAPLRQQGEALLAPKFLNETVSPAYNQAVMRALELEPNRRFQSMQEFKAAVYNQGPKPSRSRTVGF